MITQQPGAPPGSGGNKWMPLTMQVGSCPPGLEYLAMIDKIHIAQAVELLEVIIGWECANKYTIQNGIGQQIYYAFEESECCERLFCKQRRTFVIHIVDNANREVMRIKRHFKCCAMGCSCCACCQELVEVEAPPGNPIGAIQQKYKYPNRPHYVARDASGTSIFTLTGPSCCVMCSCCDKVFKVEVDGSPVGEIRKRWGGILKEAFTKADTFGVSFPPTMPVLHKAILVGATFFIDFMHFEKEQD